MNSIETTLSERPVVSEGKVYLLIKTVETRGINSATFLNHINATFANWLKYVDIGKHITIYLALEKAFEMGRLIGQREAEK